ncbi:hypothetical protein [Pseudoduganella umbonata]|uniref:Uncharacterized protein n=1 Tax=Pseudoduganella umbonata TaxID=864828 RepID=A0A4P8HVJ7_9BURK|nr:hypothetical protein [Pseudoduganella umbonata]MBB3222268.1 hypothetical protein [Pseudoduganella umbonata]QCP12495.1 hypothetical protein FCL38_20230 [Pseudoduganella umbonata]
MFNHFISSLVNADTVEVQETITSFLLSYIISIQDVQPVNAVIATLSTIAVRDTFELHIEAGGSHLTINTIPFDTAEVNAFAIEAEEVGEISVSLKITKNKVNDVISIYSIAEFEKYLSSAKFTAVLATLSSLLEGILHFNVMDSIGEFSTHTLSFGQSPSNVRTQNLDRRAIIGNFKEGSSFSGVSGFALLPNDFHFRDPCGRAAFDRFFALACGTLSLVYLSNVSDLDRDGKLSLRMYGYKAVIIENIDTDYVIQNAPMLYKIYRWVYDTDTVADRLGLARNVISLHLNQNGHPIFSQAVLDAIHSNYQIYLKGNIESYLEVKGKIAEMLLDAINKTNVLSESMLDSLKNNALIIITFLLTVVIINGVKDLSVNSVFSWPYLIIVVFLSATSWIWLRLMRSDVNDRFEVASVTLANVLQTNYQGVLLPNEINRSVTPAIAENKVQLQKQIDKYASWWNKMLWSFLLLYIAGFLVFNFVAGQKNINSDSKVETKEQHTERERSVKKITVKPRYIGPEM